jgi:hypothetical protein
MPSQLAQELSERFANDAEILRLRAAAGGAEAGPDAETSERMADACDRVSSLFASARGAPPEAVDALLPVLERYRTEEDDANVRAVYRGAIMRVRNRPGKV